MEIIKLIKLDIYTKLIGRQKIIFYWKQNILIAIQFSSLITQEGLTIWVIN